MLGSGHDERAAREGTDPHVSGRPRAAQFFRESFHLAHVDDGAEAELCLPPTLTALPEAHIASFVGGLFDAGGSAHGDRMLVWAGDPALGSDLSYALLRLGLRAKLRAERRVALCVLEGKGQVARFCDRVELLHPGKREAVRRVARSADLALLAPGLQRSVTAGAWFAPNGDRRASRSIVWEPVIAIETVSDHGHAKVYDLTVEGSHTFVAGYGGLIAHNTTLLNVLSSFIPSDERIVTIEDAAELQLRQDHVVSLESRPPNIEGRGAITIRDLVRNSLRMRPDRIVVGECRGGEALDMLQAMNTGHDGSLTTGHANSPRDMLSRLETMVLMSGMDLPVRAIREQISSAIDLIIQQSRAARRQPQGDSHHRSAGNGGGCHHSPGHLCLCPTRRGRAGQDRREAATDRHQAQVYRPLRRRGDLDLPGLFGFE